PPPRPILRTTPVGRESPVRQNFLPGHNPPPVRTCHRPAPMSTLPPLRPTRTPADPTVTPGPGLARVHDPVLNGPRLPYPARELLQELLDLRLTDPPAIREFLSKSAEKLPGLTSRDRAGQALAHAGLLTPFQRDRVIAGSTFGLVLGSYRVLDRIGG